MTIELRDVTEQDIAIFFDFMQDKEQQWQAAFISEHPEDQAAHTNHWNKILADPANLNLTIEVDGLVVGNIGRWWLDGVPQLTYWVGNQYSNKGYATEALKLFLTIETNRPLEARCAFDNQGSIRVLEKNGFVLAGSDHYFSNARKEEITELIFRLT